MAHGIEETVARGICIGCGACSVATGGAIPVRLGRTRLYEPDISLVADDQLARATRVCPFSDDAADEDELGPPHKGEESDLSHDHRLGGYSRIVVGRHLRNEQLLKSSSGGLCTWLLQELVESGRVDAVIHVGRQPGEELFSYNVSETSVEIASKRKSQYYSVTLSEALARIKGDGRRYAIVGVPCFIKAARLLCREDSELATQLQIFVGLVCGHLKSQFYAESLAWQVGVPPAELAEVDFRVKNPTRGADDYDFGARARGQDEWSYQRTTELVGGNWGHGAMHPEACNFCDDIFAETADIVFGDAWLPEFRDEWRGTNIVVSRNPMIDAMLDQAVALGEIEIRDVSADTAAETQAGNFRHRWIGLAVRLADDIAKGLSVPKKRIAPNNRSASVHRRRLIRQRRRMSVLSLSAFEEARDRGDLSLYTRVMSREISRYRRIDRPFGWKLMVRLKKVLDGFSADRDA
ncbi:Coenzyme F420 hydrogenase/dehydrogenase, beta subunit C-terminal domain [Agromyces sp. PvR057]|uniref:Coenzyme F420 hydrogenase/dehydrogenase, beta subunit C-terminal domain n=1 Tax=Agromyces sp. PvR057 TaxID=3156403 RepID=UPI003393427D